MKPARRILEKNQRGEVVTGLLALTHVWHGLVEMVRDAGYDYLIVDCEHGAYGPELVADTCATARLIDFAAFIRPIDCKYSTIRQAMDRGPSGLLLPRVESARELDEGRDAIYMPPRGRRSPGGRANRWVSGYDYSNWKEEIEDDLIVLPQIETKTGLEHVDEIAAHEVTTAVAIGPFDLAASLGVCNQMDAPVVVEAIDTIRKAAERAGKLMWRIGDGPRLAKEGFTFLCVGDPIILMEGHLAKVNAETKDR